MSNASELLFDIRVIQSGNEALIMAEVEALAGTPTSRAEGRRPLPDLGPLVKRLHTALYLGAHVRRGGGGALATAEADPKVVQELGGTLFDWLFPPEILALYRRSVERADTGPVRRRVRVNLRVEAPSLAAAPWETLYDHDNRLYLCLGTNVLLTRGVQPPDLHLDGQQPLRILVMVADPTHDGARQLPMLDPDAEILHIRKALKRLTGRKLVQIDQVRSGNRRELIKKLAAASQQNFCYDIFHFIGHGDFNVDQGLGYLLFREVGGCHAEHIYADHLCAILDENRPKLVVLNSCRGASSGNGDLFSSTAAMLIMRRVPAVVAMQFEVSDEAARCFSSEFYYWLAQEGEPIHKALVQARWRMKQLGPEWVTPVLFMRSVDGRILAPAVAQAVTS